jgi:predicted deacylase
MSDYEIMVETRSIRIEPVGTHNTVQPFSSQIRKGVESEIRVHEIKGSPQRPKIYVGDGIHGDELNGVAAVIKLLRIIPQNRLRGTIVLVPLQNPAAFGFRERLNPFDPIDPDWVHPGKLNGTYTQRVKHVLNSLAGDAYCVIDLHTSGRGGANNPMVYVPPETGNGSGSKSLDLAKSFGGDRLVFGTSEDDYGWPVRNAMPFVAAREGKMGLYAEAGAGGASIPDSRHVDYFVRGVLNVMKALGMIDGAIEEQGERLIASPTMPEAGAHSSLSGLFMPFEALGSRVSTGATLGEIWDLNGRVETVLSPADGQITFMNQFGSVGCGDRLFTISL